MKLARMATEGILIPTKSLMRHIKVEKFDTVEEEEACVEDCRVMFDCLYHQDGNFNANYGERDECGGQSEIMERFVRVTLMPI